MATVVGITGMQLSKDELRGLVAGVTRGIAQACEFPEEKVSMMILPPLSEECHGPTVEDRITYFVYTHVGKSPEMKARLVKNIYDETVAVTGHRGDYKVITFIKEHVFTNCGFDNWLGSETEANPFEKTN